MLFRTFKMRIKTYLDALTTHSNKCVLSNFKISLVLSVAFRPGCTRRSWEDSYTCLSAPSSKCSSGPRLSCPCSRTSSRNTCRRNTWCCWRSCAASSRCWWACCGWVSSRAYISYRSRGRTTTAVIGAWNSKRFLGNCAMKIRFHTSSFHSVHKINNTKTSCCVFY